MGLSRNLPGQSVNGYGRIAKINYVTDFIIIIDVIERSENNIAPLTFPIKGLKAVDALGNVKDLTVPLVQDTVWIKLMQTSSTGSPDLGDKITVYRSSEHPRPNPLHRAAFGRTQYPPRCGRLAEGAIYPAYSHKARRSGETIDGEIGEKRRKSPETKI
jgi:hypothetical protein